MVFYQTPLVLARVIIHVHDYPIFTFRMRQPQNWAVRSCHLHCLNPKFLSPKVPKISLFKALLILQNLHAEKPCSARMDDFLENF